MNDKNAVGWCRTCGVVQWRSESRQASPSWCDGDNVPCCVTKGCEAAWGVDIVELACSTCATPSLRVAGYEHRHMKEPLFAPCRHVDHGGVTFDFNETVALLERMLQASDAGVDVYADALFKEAV